MITEKTTNGYDVECSDMKVSKEALWHLFTDLVKALAIASIAYGLAYGLIDLARRALVS